MSELASTPKASLHRLGAMLRTCRPHGSSSEHDFIAKFLLPYGCESDGFGNLWLRIGQAPMLWSSHVDTCHRKPGGQHIFALNNIISLKPGSPSNCLGADCTAGVWLMMEMIEAGIEGLYVFHRGEERGGLGSRYVAAAEPERLKGIEAAIAFDRRGASSIITHQGGQRCCSETFAESLAQALRLNHQTDPTGAFTDTANYVDLVGECTNVSVGYENEHTRDERLDLDYLVRLRSALLTADFTSLSFCRQPGLEDFYGYAATPPRYAGRRLYDVVRDHPHAVADFLEANGVHVRDLIDFIGDDIPF